MISPPGSALWSRFAATLVAAAAAAAALLYAFVVALDPYGVRAAPGRPPSAIMDLNQRFMYPQIVRSGRYDAAVFGTSTVRLLDPVQLGETFRARFANLGLNAGTPWEQMQLADLFLRTVPAPKALVLGLDTTWCEEDADRKTLTFRTFPPWLYDDARWNDWPQLFNLTTVEIAGRLLLHRLGLMPERIREDGFEVFVPNDALYDLARARTHLRRPHPPTAVPVELAPEQRMALRMPALAWLDAILARVPSTTAVTLLTAPIHAASQPQPGTRAAAVDNECKARIAAIAKRHEAAFVDFRIPSPITREDSNYWDELHYRIGIAERIVRALAEARATGSDAPDGFYRVLNPPGR